MDIMFAYLTASLILLPWLAPLFWDTKVDKLIASDDTGIIQKLFSLRAAVCPAIIKYPKLLMAVCNITVPAETIISIIPMDNPCPNKSLYSSLSNLKCSFFGIRIGHFKKIYIIHNTPEIPCEITVATAAPLIPILNWVINKISKTIFNTDEIIRNTRGITLFPIALKNPAHRLYKNITATNIVTV